MRLQNKLIAIFIFFTVSFMALKYLYAQENMKDKGYMPKKGFVPDEKTAIRIAEAIWLPIYGDNVKNEKPFVAELRDSTVWVVKGTLKEVKGGVAYIEIRKDDCRILKVSHGK